MNRFATEALEFSIPGVTYVALMIARRVAQRGGAGRPEANWPRVAVAFVFAVIPALVAVVYGQIYGR